MLISTFKGRVQNQDNILAYEFVCRQIDHAFYPSNYTLEEQRTLPECQIEPTMWKI